MQALRSTDQHLATASGEVVMAADEAPYMRELAKAAVNNTSQEDGRGGRVLEIGFGMGISVRQPTNPL